MKTDSPLLRLSFLGPEFLTWLYFHLEQQTEVDLCIAVGKKISLRPLSNDDTSMSVTGPMLDDSGEILQAIGNGSYITSVSLDIVLDGRSYGFTLDADGAFSQVKLQFSFKEKEEADERDNNKMSEEESVLVRMSALDEIEDIIDKLFMSFLDRRLAQGFVSQDVTNMRVTVAKTLGEKIPRMPKQMQSMLSSTKSPIAQLEEP